MCVRTKNSFGCGHVYKDTVQCHGSTCTGLERYHFLRDGDCQKCKSAGSSNTRGLDGKGRYAQEQKLRAREPLRNISNPAPRSKPTAQSDATDLSSPWNSPRKGEKEWKTPTRLKADDAWLTEHADRQSVSSRGTPTRDLVSRSQPPLSRRDNVEARLGRELRKIQEAENRGERRRRERLDSFDSFDSFDHVDRGYRQSKSSSQRDNHRPSHGYGYDHGSSHRSHGHGNDYHSRSDHRQSHDRYSPGYRLTSDPNSHYGTSHSYIYELPDQNYDLGHGIESVMLESNAGRRRRW